VAAWRWGRSGPEAVTVTDSWPLRCRSSSSGVPGHDCCHLTEQSVTTVFPPPEESESGVSAAVGMRLRAAGEPVAALSVACPSVRYTPERSRVFIRELRAAVVRPRPTSPCKPASSAPPLPVTQH
jgi:Bacterial transcriptional regulator